MNAWFAIIYFLFFAVIAGSAFALMWGNIQKTYRTKPAKQHPEAPEAGEKVLYVDLSRKKLEDLYRK